MRDTNIESENDHAYDLGFREATSISQRKIKELTETIQRLVKENERLKRDNDSMSNSGAFDGDL